MTTPAITYTGSESSLIALTGNAMVDAFLSGSKWGTAAPGVSAAVTFGFPSSIAVYDASASFGAYGDANFSGYIASTDFSVFGASEQAAVREVLQGWADIANISFSEVQANSTTAAMLRFNYTGIPGLAAGTYAVSWFPMDIPAAGDTWVNLRFFYPDGWTAGSQNRLTLLHEIGHALGLKHPHDTGLAGVFAEWPSTTAILPFTGTDTLTDYSTEDAVMAYNDVPGIGSPVQADYAPTTPMRLDIAALQYLYGANTAFNAGDTAYTYGSNGHYNETIWDGGGIDTIVVAGSSGAVINLAPGSWSQIGLPITYSERNVTDLTVAAARPDLTRTDTVFIYDTVTIENAQGGTGNDSITGNTVANRLQGGGGSDTLDGGAGIDTALFSGNSSGYTCTSQAGSFTVQDNTGFDGADSLTNIERLMFADDKIALDLSGNAGMTAKLLGAVFGKDFVSNKAYVGIGLGLLDGGMSYVDLAALAVNAAGGVAPTQVVDLLWTNVVGSAPSAAQAQPFVDMLNSGTSIGVLGVLAADTALNQENINLSGLAQTGLAYT